MGEQKNLFLFVAIAVAIFLIWDLLVTGPQRERLQEARRAEQARQAEISQTVQPDQGPAAGTAAPAPAAAGPLDRAQALAESGRVTIRSPEIDGSISLTGGLIDDVSLVTYRQEIDPQSPEVTLLSPRRAPGEYYARLGWLQTSGSGGELVGASTPWRLAAGQTLTPDTPVTLAYDAPNGLAFQRRISIDDHFMFTIVDRVTNNSGAPVDLRLYGAVVRRGVPELTGRSVVHEGPIGMFDNSRITKKYKDLQKDQTFERRSVGGWLGITDKFWLAAVIPHPGAALDGKFDAAQQRGEPVFQASWTQDPETLDAGEVIETESYVFAGAKRAQLLRDYQAQLGIHRLVDAIDWGDWFFFLTKPFFFVLEYFAQLTHNFGLAILMLVVVLKALTFPLANMSFKSMARMKQLQPKVKELQERFKGDQERLQKEMMALYQREKVNPLAGCLPLFVQIPVFYALYKTLYVTIEMRHAPFFGWIQDLSARDPTNVWNLFGLLPFDPAHIPVLGGLIGGTGFLALGFLSLLYGLTMAAMQTLNPPPPDPVQAKVFGYMPWIFMFIMAGFPAGLMIYWVWNNTLSFGQQYVIMRRQGVETPIGTFISKRYQELRGRLSGGAPPGGGQDDRATRPRGRVRPGRRKQE